MKKHFVMMLALLVAVAIAMPAFAVEFKYGGLYRVRYQSNDNVRDGHDDLDDNGNWIDQRLRMFFNFIASERLQLVTKWEADTVWGNETPGAGRHGGGDVGADATNLEMKNAYIDFFIPGTPSRAIVGVQGMALLSGWIIDDDFSAARLVTPMGPAELTLGYVGARNEDVTSDDEDVDDWFISLAYAQGPFKANLVGFYQYSHDFGGGLDDPAHAGSRIIGSTARGEAEAEFGADPFPIDPVVGSTDNHFFDIGLALTYKTDMFSVFVNGIKNLGEFDTMVGDVELDDEEYEGWMVEAGASFFVQNFTFNVGGFWTSGDEVFSDDYSSYFRQPLGASHYWSEIMGLGTLDVSVGEANESDRVQAQAGYRAGDAPTNLWTVTAGVAYQALEKTKLTFNYYYIGTDEDVVSTVFEDELGNLVAFETDDSIGHELNLYIDQDVVDGLQLRLVGAYMFAEDAYTVFDEDDDVYELGARLQWAF